MKEQNKNRCWLIARAIILILTLGNIILEALDMNPISFDANQIYGAISVIAALVAVVYNVWKNFNWTQAAQKGQEVVDSMKRGNMEVLKEVGESLLQFVCDINDQDNLEK